MRTNFRKLALGVSLLCLTFSCQKNEKATAENIQQELNTEDVSYAASQEIKAKEFIKKAEVNVEVEDVFKTTISLENQLKDIGGFVTSSNMHSIVISEKTTPISDSEAELTRIYTMVNDLYVSVPSEKLADFLININQNQVFLHSRIITAEDVTANLKMAEWEKNRLQKNEKDLNQLKPSKGQVDRKNNSRQEENQRKLDHFTIENQVKYSTVYFHLEEPSEKISVIKVANSKSFQNNLHFWYEIKNSISDGYYGILQFFIYLSKAWAFILVGILVWFGIKKLKWTKNTTKY